MRYLATEPQLIVLPDVPCLRRSLPPPQEQDLPAPNAVSTARGTGRARFRNANARESGARRMNHAIVEPAPGALVN